MSKLTITIIAIFVALLVDFLPIKSWLNARGFKLVVPLFFSLALVGLTILSRFDNNHRIHWYDLVIALIVFLYEWFDFFRQQHVKG